MRTLLRRKAAFIFYITLLVSLGAPVSSAKTAAEIDAAVDGALERFEEEVYGSAALLGKAKGILVFPKVIKAGIGFGGEYGEGALRIGGKTEEYYNTVGGSFGFQFGAQVKSVYLLFMEDKALRDFRYSDGWKVGVDGSVALVTVGADGSIDTTQTSQPIVGFVLGQKGLMYNLTLEGSKYNRLDK